MDTQTSPLDRRQRADQSRAAQDDKLFQVVAPYIARRQRLPIADIAQLFGLHKTTLRERLCRLVEEGRLERLPGVYKFKIVSSETAKAPVRWTPGSIVPPTPMQMMGRR